MKIKVLVIFPEYHFKVKSFSTNIAKSFSASRHNGTQQPMTWIL